MVSRIRARKPALDNPTGGRDGRRASSDAASGGSGPRRERDPVRPGADAQRFEQVGLPSHALDAWFAATLRNGFALTAAGAYPGFRDVASDALRALLASHGVDDADAVDQVLAGFAELPAHPDVSPGLHRIHAASIRLVTLTNAATAISDRMLDQAGVLPLLEHRLSVEVPKRWKPHPDAYRYAAEVCGVEPARWRWSPPHPWDVDGAHRAGLTSVWVDRRKTPYPLAFLPPDIPGSQPRGARGHAERIVTPPGRTAVVAGSGGLRSASAAASAWSPQQSRSISGSADGHTGAYGRTARGGLRVDHGAIGGNRATTALAEGVPARTPQCAECGSGRDLADAVIAGGERV